MSVAGHDVAYEQAVLRARADPRMHKVLEEAFLDDGAEGVLERFARSEHAARARRLLLAAGARPGARVLDVGGGRGILSAFLASEGYDVVLCEPNPSEVCGAGAARELSRRRAGGFTVHEGVVAELPLDEPFDAAICRAVLHHVEPLVPVLADVRARLRPGSAFVAMDEPTVRRGRHEAVVQAEHPFVPFGVEEHAFTPAYYRRALRHAGFVEVRTSFPVAAADYVAAGAHRGPGGRLRYRLYRARDQLRHPPGAVRVLVGRRPAG
jgi:2-polyprenyl-3-methyl-5-hydroxy-6-metoxy-1,4-benzoquinol methylase